MGILIGGGNSGLFFGDDLPLNARLVRCSEISTIMDVEFYGGRLGVGLRTVWYIRSKSPASLEAERDLDFFVTSLH